MNGEDGFNSTWEPPVQPEERLDLYADWPVSNQPVASSPDLSELYEERTAPRAQLNLERVGGQVAPPTAAQPTAQQPAVPPAFPPPTTVMPVVSHSAPPTPPPPAPSTLAPAGFPAPYGASSPGPGPQPFIGAHQPVEYASFWRRLSARLLDGLFLSLVFLPIYAGVIAGIAAAIDVDPVFAILVGLVLDVGIWEAVYYLVGASHGQTVGKQVLGIKVCRDATGERLGFWLSVGRVLAANLSSLALFIGWLAPLWSPKRQTWHDSMTGTVVIHDDEAKLAKPAVVWGLIWTLLLAGAVGGLLAWGGSALSDYDYPSTSGYYDFDSGQSYGDETDYGQGYESGDGSDDYGYDYDDTTTTVDQEYYNYDDQEESSGELDDSDDTGDLAYYQDRIESIAEDSFDEAIDLDGRWVVQLASMKTEGDSGVESSYGVFDRFGEYENYYSGSGAPPLLLRSGDFNFKYADYWVVILDRDFGSPEAVLDFCSSEGYSRDDCLAKHLERSGSWKDSTEMLPG